MKKILLLILTIIMVGQSFAQRRTTSVKGYYKKNGTYVSPHTRHYNAGSSSYSSGSYSSNSTEPNSEENIPLTTLSVATIDKLEFTNSTSKYKHSKGEKIISTTLSRDNDTSNNIVETDTIKSNQETNNNGIIIYVSVLRYDGKTIDICPVSRDYSGDWDFNKVQHHFQKKSITAEEALILISDYGWIISEEDLKKDFTYDYISSKGFPKFLTKTIEAMKLK